MNQYEEFLIALPKLRVAMQTDLLALALYRDWFGLQMRIGEFQGDAITPILDYVGRESSSKRITQGGISRG